MMSSKLQLGMPQIVSICGIHQFSHSKCASKGYTAIKNGSIRLKYKVQV